MSAMRKRLDALERTDKPRLSARARQWLGLPLSPEEEWQIVTDAGVEMDWDAVDTSDWSKEAKAWLGVN